MSIVYELELTTEECLTLFEALFTSSGEYFEAVENLAMERKWIYPRLSIDATLQRILAAILFKTCLNTGGSFMPEEARITCMQLKYINAFIFYVSSTFNLPV
jgi:hypothetical protein